jgi:hypothetical protein
MTITKGLFEALCALRQTVSTRRLWADAICINQKDDIEKGHQVKKMGKVYENAKGVPVWLGTDPHGSAKDCFQLIRETLA